jgi:hypothetical protein
MPLYRIRDEFSGHGANKRLSAHTIASFLALQNVDDVDLLSVEIAMPKDQLLRLVRSSAFYWWLGGGEATEHGEPWLRVDGSSVYLTPLGLAKVHARVSGTERTSNGRKSSYNVDPEEVSTARDLILYGPRVTSVDLEVIE